MKLNPVEKALMNNPVRALIQRRYEAALMERLGRRVEGQRVLEVGCGRGVGTEIIFKRFGAREVHAFDLDPDMVARASDRLSAYPPDRLKLFVGDATAIEEPDGAFDAVFDFAIIHHIPNWKDAVSEIARVLKAEGLFFFEEVTSYALGRWFYVCGMTVKPETAAGSFECDGRTYYFCSTHCLKKFRADASGNSPEQTRFVPKVRDGARTSRAANGGG